MFDFEALSEAIRNQTVLCVGDLMLDEFVYGEVSRVSPEAPAPVIAVQRSEDASAAPATSRAISPRSAADASLPAWSARRCGSELRAELAREG